LTGSCKRLSPTRIGLPPAEDDADNAQLPPGRADRFVSKKQGFPNTRTYGKMKNGKSILIALTAQSDISI